jgi:hypothetical protein
MFRPGGTVVRLETLSGRFLYAIEVSPATISISARQMCIAQPGRGAVRMTAVTPPDKLSVLRSDRLLRGSR